MPLTAAHHLCAAAGAFLGLTFLMIFTTTLVVTMMRKMGKNESSTTDLT
jgi:hypothetical protein